LRFDRFLQEACPPLDLEWRKYRRRAARHRIEARLKELALPDFAAYLERLRRDPVEAAGLAERMAVTVSRFYRERERWEILRQKVLPGILEKMGTKEPLRLWSAGCCGGEEPYTLALLWLANFHRGQPDRPVEILGTDADAPSLERARRALYRAGSLREVPPEIRQRYFRREKDQWLLEGPVRAMVDFVERDLMDDSPSDPFDLVCCRYLAFTYYRGRRLLEAARRLRGALRPGGALMIGRKEELGAAAELFEPWPGAVGVFRRRSNPGKAKT
jgi:chemotaxis protein methyltransferase CheR